MRAARLARLRADLATSSIDALVITHPPNVRYLTGLRASAGVVVVTPSACELLVDFRYVTAAQNLVADQPDLSVRVAAGAFEPAIVEMLQRAGAARIGVEGAYMPIVRYNRLSTLLAGGAPLPMADGPVPVLVPTERIVERARAVKDLQEIAILREAARRLSAVARELPHLVCTGQTEQQAAANVE